MIRDDPRPLSRTPRGPPAQTWMTAESTAVKAWWFCDDHRSIGSLFISPHPRSSGFPDEGSVFDYFPGAGNKPVTQLDDHSHCISAILKTYATSTSGILGGENLQVGTVEQKDRILWDSEGCRGACFPIARYPMMELQKADFDSFCSILRQPTGCN